MPACMPTMFRVNALRGPSQAADSPFKFVFLNGGKFACADVSERSGVLRDYARAIVAGQKVSLVEIKTFPTFVFFIDLDFPACYDKEDIEDFTRKLCKAVHETCGGRRICVASCFRANKRGVHLVCPGLVCTGAQAAAWRASLLASMRRIGHSCRDCDMDAIIDESVYRKGTGLRMLFSVKKDDMNVYVPWIDWTIAEGFERCVVPQSVDDIANILLMFGVQDCDVRTSLLKPATPACERDACERDEGDANNAAWTSLLRDLNVLTCSESVTKITVSKNKECVLKTNSKACRNLRRLNGHNNANIYFVASINADAICLHQKCYCRCNTTKERRHNKPCSKITLSVHPFPLKRTPPHQYISDLFEKTQASST